jgi:mono/diheme cytochrome c family protein
MKRSELLSRILMISGVFLALAAQAGVPLRLRLTSDDVMHGFAVGQSEIAAVDVLPGQMTEMTLTFDEPGTYTFYCTRWCGPNHWRMRGTIEVSGENAISPQPGAEPLYVTLGLDIDAAHPAAATPLRTPDAQRGAVFSTLLPTGYLLPDYYRSHAPAQLYLDLRADPALSSLENPDVWDLVAYIWQSNTSPEGLAEGQRLFAQNCAACHGETGGGNGVFSADINALAGRYPVNFSDPASMLGASPALLQGKILRGGMGTGMPSWGPILTDQQTWDLISYLFTFHFKEKTK